MNKTFSSFAFALGLFAFATGCGGETTAFAPCESHLEVSRGARPTYRFTGGPVTAISVARNDEPNKIVWGLASPDVDGLTSPLEHASQPDKTIQTAQAERTLRGAVRYRARIQRLSGEVCEVEFLVQ